MPRNTAMPIIGEVKQADVYMLFTITSPHIFPKLLYIPTFSFLCNTTSHSNNLYVASCVSVYLFFFLSVLWDKVGCT